MEVHITESAEEYLQQQVGKEQIFRFILKKIDWKGPRYDLALVEPAADNENLALNEREKMVISSDYKFIYDEILAKTANKIKIDYKSVGGEKILLIYNNNFHKEALEKYQGNLIKDWFELTFQDKLDTGKELKKYG